VAQQGGRLRSAVEGAASDRPSAVDLVAGPRGSWDQIDALARWAEPTQDHPSPSFRWVGYDGDAGHGRGNHLHLSWNHNPTPSARPPAAWVSVLIPPA